MDTMVKLNKLIEKLLSTIHKPHSYNERIDINTLTMLFKLASTVNWREEEITDHSSPLNIMIY